jgi:hypothetical protein
MTRRNVWLLLMSVVVGPLLGSLAFMAGATIFDALFAGGGPGAFAFMADYWPIVLTTGYAAGCIPALIFALVMMALSPRIPRRRTRLWVAPLVGAAASLVIIGFFVLGALSGWADNAGTLLAIALTGAFSGFVSMLVIEWLHPLPEPAQAAP